MIALIVALLLLGGCTNMIPGRPGDTPAPKFTIMPTATPTPAPTPTPVAPPAVLLLADCEREAIEPYLNSLMEALEELDWRVTQQYAVEGFPEEISPDAYDGVLVLRTKKETSLAPVNEIIAQGMPVSIIDLFPEAEGPQGASYFWYNAENLEAYTLNVALDYPPHDTPVRLIGLFTEKGSPAHEAFREAVKEGKVLEKGSFYAAGKPQRAKAFMEEQLEEYVEGTVDAVYAETLPLALAALVALTERDRTDMEVFAVPEGMIYVQQELLSRYVFPVAIGVDPAQWAFSQVSALAGMLRGGAPVKSIIGTSIATYEERIKNEQ